VIAAPPGSARELDGSSPPSDLRAALFRLDLRLRLAVESFRADLAERARDPFRGLYISDADVDELLASTPASELAQRLLDEQVGPVPARLRRLGDLFDLDAFERDVLLVCLAPDVDLRYERLYAYLQDDVSRRRPTVDLTLRLLGASARNGSADARAALGPGGRLTRRGLLTPPPDEAGQASLLARPLRVEERVVEYLVGSDRIDVRLEPFARVLSAEDTPAAWSLPEDARAGLVRLLRDPIDRRARLLYLCGPAAAAKRVTARAACAQAGRPLLLVDTRPLLVAHGERAGLLLGSAVREALLQGAVLALDGFDALLGDEPAANLALAALRRALADSSSTVLLLGELRWEPAAWLPSRAGLRLDLSSLAAGDRIRLWRSQVDGQLPSEAIPELAARYRLVEDDDLHAVTSEARSRAELRGSARIGADDVRAAARTIATPPLEGLARHIEPRYTWDDIVLPADGLAQLREMCARARHQMTVLEQWGYGRKHARRRGTTALFAGPPGTGKTMAAEIIAGSLGLDLYRIDLSAVVSKYIGETEKNLERIFRAADQGDAVLLFDEADAIFGKRSEVRDARDRYANVEVAYLLQRLETYEGLAVLTTNLRGNIDEAFVRRLDCVLEFPLPEEAERLQIWKRSLPPEAPLADDVDLPFLARKFKLAGGHIRNIALTAAFLAAEDGSAITMKHLARATRREFQKLGKLIAESDFEHHYSLLKVDGRSESTTRG
jgi:SpoVK/Ycf46/Vps4 family AAA+-type ATPase